MKWKDFENQEVQQLNKIWQDIVKEQISTFPKTCPSCHSKATLHLYLHIHNNINHRGGAWFWCSKCKSFTHLSVIIPIWWINLSLINFNNLEAVPEYLETISKEIDAHWHNFKTMQKI